MAEIQPNVVGICSILYNKEADEATIVIEPEQLGQPGLSIRFQQVEFEIIPRFDPKAEAIVSITIPRASEFMSKHVLGLAE